jgi:hypothetical protein
MLTNSIFYSSIERFFTGCPSAQEHRAPYERVTTDPEGKGQMFHGGIAMSQLAKGKDLQKQGLIV